MNVETQVERLQSLLGRIQHNAAELARQRGFAPRQAGSVPDLSAASPTSAATDVSSDDLAWDEPATHLPPVKPKDALTELPGDEPALEIEVAEDLSDELGEEDLLTIPPSQPPPDAGETLQGMPPAPALPRDASSLPPAQRDSQLPAHSGPVFTAQRSLQDVHGAEPGLEREAELRTPPPESGPQITTATIADELAPPASGAPRPAAEQIGASVELEVSSVDEADLELASDALSDSAEADIGEESLPRPSFPAQYDASLAPPASAREDLAARQGLHRPRQDTHQDDGLLAPPPAPAELAAGPVPATTHVRSAVRVDQRAATYEAPRAPQRELTFVERLERALALGRSPTDTR